jgi:hypothetical protein
LPAIKKRVYFVGYRGESGESGDVGGQGEPGDAGHFIMDIKGVKGIKGPTGDRGELALQPKFSLGLPYQHFPELLLLFMLPVTDFCQSD